MKVALVVLGCFMGVALARPDGYTTKWDNIDLDQILSSDRLIQNYFNCLMEKGNCTPEGKDLRTILPDALETRCAKCNEKQRDGAAKIIKFMVEKKPEMWKDLMDKYDPEKKYRVKFEEEARAHGININTAN